MDGGDGRVVHRWLGGRSDHHGARKLGVVVGPDCTLRMVAGNIRIPDVSFTSWGRLPNRSVPQEQVPAVSPDLAVEVLCPSNTIAEMTLKRQEYFQSGTRLVWEFDVRDRTVFVYVKPDQPIMLAENDTLDGGDVLPGLQISLRELFAELDEIGER